MFRPRRVLVLATRHCPDLLTALVAALEKYDVHAAIEKLGDEADTQADVLIAAVQIGDAIPASGIEASGIEAGVRRAEADFWVLVLREDVASVTAGFMALKAMLGASGSKAGLPGRAKAGANIGPCGVAVLIDAPTSAAAALQAHRSLNRAVTQFLRLELIHAPDIEADGEGVRAAARSLARRMSAKLRLHQPSSRREMVALRASG
jgi:hypothetical protein